MKGEGIIIEIFRMNMPGSWYGIFETQQDELVSGVLLKNNIIYPDVCLA